jgi:hypothetical protein
MIIINYISFLSVFKDKSLNFSFLENKCSLFQSRNNLLFHSYLYIKAIIDLWFVLNVFQHPRLWWDD